MEPNLRCKLRAFDVHAVETLMLRLMSEYNVPGAALALIKNGRIVLEKGYGFRDMEIHAPVTTETLFNIGSISKSVTALGIAQLVDRHRVDLDTPVVNYVPDLRLSDPRVTSRQLLSHTSGFPPSEQWPLRMSPSRQGIIREFATMSITAQPGTRFQYCGPCVVLAAYVLERITGQSWEAYTRAHIFAPLGMTTASFGPGGLEQATDSARPYQHDAVSGHTRVPWERLAYLDPVGPSGGIDASITDMARYALFQLGDGTMVGRRVVSAALLAKLHRPEIAVPSWTFGPVQDLHYALGCYTGEYQGVHLVYFGGANPGFRAAILLAPSAGAGVVILTNGESDAFVRTVPPNLFAQLR